MQSLFADWKLKMRLSLHAHSSSAKGSCFEKRNKQKHSSQTDENVVATGTCSSESLTSRESSNGIKSCRHVDESTWKTES